MRIFHTTGFTDCNRNPFAEHPLERAIAFAQVALLAGFLELLLLLYTLLLLLLLLSSCLPLPPVSLLDCLESLFMSALIYATVGISALCIFRERLSLNVSVCV